MGRKEGEGKRGGVRERGGEGRGGREGRKGGGEVKREGWEEEGIGEWEVESRGLRSTGCAHGIQGSRWDVYTAEWTLAYLDQMQSVLAKSDLNRWSRRAVYTL